MEITYFDDYRQELVTCPLASAPDVFVNPSATTDDLREWHAERKAELDEFGFRTWLTSDLLD